MLFISRKVYFKMSPFKPVIMIANDQVVRRIPITWFYPSLICKLTVPNSSKRSLLNFHNSYTEF
jgi:hypothetical protein